MSEEKKLERYVVNHPRYGETVVLATTRNGAAHVAAGYRKERGDEWAKECFIMRLER